MAATAPTTATIRLRRICMFNRPPVKDEHEQARLNPFVPGEQLDGLAGLVDLDPVGLGGIRSLSAARVDDDDFVCGAIEMLACLSGQNGRSSKLQATHGWSPPDRRFHLVGDIFGLENGSTHRFTAEAVVKTSVRLIKRQSLEAVAESDAVVTRNLFSMTTSNLEHAENHMLLLGRKTSLEKVAAFLPEVDGRLTPIGIMALPMSAGTLPTIWA